MTEAEAFNKTMVDNLEIAKENFGEVDEDQTRVNSSENINDPNNAVSFKPKFAMFVIVSFAYFAMI